MNLENILKALKSCGIEPERYGYGRYGGHQDCYYIKDNKYYYSYPDDFDRTKDIIHEEIESEAEFVSRYLNNITTCNRKLCSLIYILSSLCGDTSENDLKIYHHTLFEWHNPLWRICEKMNYKDPWVYCVISNSGELFNQVYHYGMGFINGKYVVERQDDVQVGDSAISKHDSLIYDNYYDAFLQLKKYADLNITERQTAVNQFIQSYKMDEEEHKLAQEMCDLLNDKIGNSSKKFATNSANANNIVYIRDYGYYSFSVFEEKIHGSVHFHANGKHMDSVIRSFCRTYEINNSTTHHLINKCLNTILC